MKRFVQSLVLLFSTIMVVMLSVTYDFFNINGMVGTIIIVIVLLVPFLIIEKYFNKREEKKPVFISVYENTMMLSKRDCENKKICSIVPYYNSYLQCNPEKPTYTGASFGGIATGEVNKEDACYSTKVELQRGRYNLYVKNILSIKIEQIRIDKIALTAELANEAKNNSFLKKFLADNVLVLRYKNAEPDMAETINTQAMFEARKNGNKALEWNIMQTSIIKSHLSKEDCQKILDWICGIDIT